MSSGEFDFLFDKDVECPNCGDKIYVSIERCMEQKRLKIRIICGECFEELWFEPEVKWKLTKKDI